jgi:hypothetical protein
MRKEVSETESLLLQAVLQVLFQAVGTFLCILGLLLAEFVIWTFARRDSVWGWLVGCTKWLLTLPACTLVLLYLCGVLFTMSVPGLDREITIYPVPFQTVLLPGIAGLEIVFILAVL